MPDQRRDLPRYTRVRHPSRGHYDRETVHAILDAGLVGHVGFIDEGRPMVIPMAYGREGDTVYIHGASKTRAVKMTAGGALGLTVTLVDGLVVARSGFNHSVNYRSAVLHGQGRLVTDPEEFDLALQRITEHLLPGRYAEIRPGTAQEWKATGVIAIDIEHATAKIRSGPPHDDEEDLALPHWAGVVPVVTALGRGVPDGHVPETMPEPASVRAARLRFAL